MIKRVYLICAFVLLIVLIRFLVSKFLFKPQSMFRPPEVNIEPVQTKSIIKSYEVPGRVEAKFQVEIVARVSGYLQKTYFKEGSCVKKGDTLFLIEPDEYNIDLASARSDVDRIQAQLEYANKQLLRANELVKKDYIAKARYDEIKSNRNSLQAQLSHAKAIVNDARRNLSYTQIKAPVDGRIGVIEVSVGNYVTPLSGALATINSIDPIYVTFSIPSADYSQISSIDKDNNTKHRVELYTDNGHKYEFDGVQDYYDNKVDETTGTVSFRANFKNPDKELLHGQFVTVKIFTNNKVKVPVVPISAVQENQEGKYVYRLDDKNTAKITYIKTEGQIDDYWLVGEGLSEGDKIITSGIIKVIPNKPVKVVVDKINE